MRLRLLAVMMLVVSCGTAPATAPLSFGPNTPDDLRALAEDTFALVSDAIPARQGCLDGVTVSGAWELDDRARYSPSQGEITIRIPATAAQLESSIVHELAHHVEFACPQDAETRRAFLAAQGLDPDADWLGGETWETTPSEQWASAVVLHVLERPDERARIAIGAEALQIVESWATGS